jgi:hypothetical protein
MKTAFYIVMGLTVIYGIRFTYFDYSKREAKKIELQKQ